MAGRKSFYTLFLTDNPFLLKKDFGLIPKFMGRCGYESHFVSYIDPEQLPNDCPDGLILDYLGNRTLPQYSFKLMFAKEVFRFLWKNARHIDVLNVVFLKFSMVYGIFYKLLKPNGVLYVKMDADVKHLEEEERKIFAPLRNLIYRLYVKFFVDYISVESTKGKEFISSTYHFEEEKLLLVPSGIDDDLVKCSAIRDFAAKENIITYIGRIGTCQKNTEFFLEACKSVLWRDDWKVFLIGGIEDSFREYLGSFILENGLSDRMVCTGLITDRSLLMDYLNRSKVFCLSSRFESFGIVCAEAQFFGNRLIITEISTDRDFVPSPTTGQIVKSPTGMAEALQHIMDDQSELSSNYDDIIAFGKRWLWSDICNKLSIRLNRKNGC